MKLLRAHRRVRWELPVFFLLLALAGCNDSSNGGSRSNSATSAINISGTPSATVAVGSVYSFQPAAGQIAGTVGYTITNKPEWASFSTASGQLLGTPTTADIGTYSKITITASDGDSTASLPQFSITVNSTGTTATSNTPGTATLTWTPPTTNTDGTPFTNLAGFYIYYGTDSTDLTGVVDDETGLDGAGSYSISGLAPGTYYFQVSAYSAMGVQSPPSNEVNVTIKS